MRCSLVIRGACNSLHRKLLSSGAVTPFRFQGEKKLKFFQVVSFPLCPIWQFLMQTRWNLVSLPSGRACQGEKEWLGTGLEVEVAVCTLGWGLGAGQRQGTFRAEHVLAAFNSGTEGGCRTGGVLPCSSLITRRVHYHPRSPHTSGGPEEGVGASGSLVDSGEGPG